MKGNEGEQHPGQVIDYFNLAEACRLNGDSAAALPWYRKALTLDPDDFASNNNLAVVLIDLGSFAEAAEVLGHALTINPSETAVHINLGIVLHKLGQLDSAVERLHSALAMAPDSATAHYHLGNVLREQGKAPDAIIHFQQALSIDPAYVDAHNGLGLAWWELGKNNEAIECYMEALRYDPRCAPALTNLGLILFRAAKLEMAVEALCQAIDADPNYAMAYLNLGSALRYRGQLAAAMDSYQHALRLEPDWLMAHQALLFLMSSAGAGTEPDYLEQVQRFGQSLDRHVQGQAFTEWPRRSHEGRLKVGMISGDLRHHPVAYFLESILAHLPDLGIDVLLYPTTNEVDGMSQHLQSMVSGWHPLVGLSDVAAAKKIHADGIDVLIDLAGHTNNNRLPVFGWRPAPLQVSWLGYFATTGVRQMDAILVDPVGVPPGGEAAFSEQLCYLPETRLCFTPPTDAPPTAALPALAKGRMTFGCFQTHAKVSDAQLQLWARVLDAVPGSMLRWQCFQFADPQCVDDTAQRLVACGIGLDRAQLFGHVDRQHYFAAHAEVDLILDTAPYPGGTTTCEALWMGVPTVTLAGATLLARQGASLMSAAGLADWVAHNEDDYLARAVAAANDLAGLASLRAGLRQQVAHSPLCDGKRFAVNLHSALRGLLIRR